MRIRGSCLSRAIALAVAVVATAVTGWTQSNWNVTLGDVRVVGQCESGGDRPYFPALYFRSKINTPGSTVVQTVEYEPHDWVSKDPFKAGLPGGHDHMFAGNDLRLPFWMSPHQWRGIQSVPNPMVNGKLDSSLVGSASHADIVGVIVIGIDNRNTPPDVIRELLDDAAKIVRQVLVDQVESGRIILPALSGNFDQFEKDVASDAMDIAGKVVDGWSIAGLLIRGGIGSFGSPDQILGVNAFMLPAVDGIALTAIPPAKNIQLSFPMFKGSLASFHQVMSFDGGCGRARYDVPISVSAEVCNPAERISSLTISLLTGEDDLRSNSVVGLKIVTANRTFDIPNFITNTGIDKRNQLIKTVPLPAPVTRADLREIGLTFTSHNDAGQTTDNWDMAAIRVDANGQTLVLQTGRPAVRFTGSMREWRTDATCTPPSRFSTAPPPLGPRMKRP